MSKKVLNYAGRQPMLLALIVMATLTLGLLFSGWLTPTPGRAQPSQPDPQPNVETTNCVVSSITTNCVGEASVTLSNIPPTMVCVGSGVSASTGTIIVDGIQSTTTCYTNAGNSGNDKCSPETIFLTNTPALLTNWWTADGCGISTNGSGLSTGSTPLIPTTNGQVTISFFQKWRHVCDTNTADAKAQGTINVYPPIEADLVDVPPTGKTYASGIDTNSIVLMLNGTIKGYSKTNIANGVHIYYRPSTNELNIPGVNTVEVRVKDNAGNVTDPDPFTWNFSM